tara:strand:+ start:7046 stop:7408 length:363 start_codon:yes stop_codon:yes gene_type:complete
MASGNFVSILKEVSCPKASETIHTSDSVALENHMIDLLLCAKCTGSGTIKFTLEHSPDGSSFSAVTDSAGEAIEFECTTGPACQCAILDTPLLPHVRATCQLGGEETALCDLDLYYRSQK